VASQTTVVLEDDLQGGPAEETVLFGLDGQTMEIDLNAKNAARLRDVLGEFVASARKAGPVNRGAAGRAPRSAAAGSRTAGDTKSIRAWAESNGHKISARGRISKKILDAFKAATE
jgi:hypothetical protein